ncbi:hypothetical protein Patl1_32808 [Pistacia atlantica]|uniref:Uncharacterized protein n=1 Tax=Pistacia atlantica TaxID=434234 RepID=A0ACC1AQX5_9ROSI|nr:hypothetical protein Patl1_32808 [Pistacia atlantica]
MRGALSVEGGSDKLCVVLTLTTIISNILLMESQLPSSKKSATFKTSNGEETSPITPETYGKIISTLPREDGWKAQLEIRFWKKLVLLFSTLA